jgi:cell wall-associated NlpC family hydrolase
MPAPSAWRRLVVALPILLVSVLGFTLLEGAPAQAQDQNKVSKHERIQNKRERKIERKLHHRKHLINNRKSKIRHGVNVALNQKGDPYRYGSAGPGSFDCSGLTMFAYKKAHLRLPRTSDGQARAVRRIGKKHMKRGDLIFFHSGGNVYHAAIYLGRKNGHRVILHAPYSGTRVRKDKIWTSSWYAGTLRRKPLSPEQRHWLKRHR